MSQNQQVTQVSKPDAVESEQMNNSVNHAAPAISAKNLDFNVGIANDTIPGAINHPSSTTPAEAESKADGVEQKGVVPSLQAASAEKPMATANRFSVPIDSSLGIQMIDERNKRGRPPKKPKLPETEHQE